MEAEGKGGDEVRALGGGYGGEDGVMPWHSRAGGTPVFLVWWQMEEMWPGSLQAWGARPAKSSRREGPLVPPGSSTADPAWRRMEARTLKDQMATREGGSE
jgi:hypothetical protein